MHAEEIVSTAGLYARPEPDQLHNSPVVKPLEGS